MTWLERATLGDLARRISEPDEIHVLHYIGHGAYDEATESGVLVLETPQGRAHDVSGEEIGAMLQDESSLRLVVLNACEGARTLAHRSVLRRGDEPRELRHPRGDRHAVRDHRRCGDRVQRESLHGSRPWSADRRGAGARPPRHHRRDDGDGVRDAGPVPARWRCASLRHRGSCGRGRDHGGSHGCQGCHGCSDVRSRCHRSLDLVRNGCGRVSCGSGGALRPRSRRRFQRWWIGPFGRGVVGMGRRDCARAHRGAAAARHRELLRHVVRRMAAVHRRRVRRAGACGRDPHGALPHSSESRRRRGGPLRTGARAECGDRHRVAHRPVFSPSGATSGMV